ncbi:hypothetical protein [Granulicella tundricola]|uniref:Lipoprotein n=1 Tax=Granulicella tundricola (strain ATCC BAA-1859 / DSM 23138 / MP5ACTX9) TaxID=1198114 RepID=E8WZT6_GRATM|nr:hypothetical protein [Granulicella tundricola]ADW67747.1 hypothetical protein AciX9_0677 [Granulicella tundricola MP5ACTX9]
MKGLLLALVLVGTGRGAVAQQGAQEMKSAAPASRPGETQEQKGKRLLDEMLKALGGDAWLNRGTVYDEGQVASFFRGQPTGAVTRFEEWKRLETAGSPEVTRIEFLTIKGMIKPGMKRDVAHLWTADQGVELTYKGKTLLPKPQVEDYMRRRGHTLDAVMKDLIKQPGVIVIAEGIGMRDRLPVDKVTVLTANNDAVTLELDQHSHLPVQRAFEWRNEQFKDHDIDEEVYGDWRYYQGIATPMNMTRYRNGDMVDQTFYVKVKYGEPMGAELFDPEKPLLKK